MTRAAAVVVAMVAACSSSKDPGGVRAYRDKSIQIEAKLELNLIGKNAKVAWAEQGTFPVGDTGLTPATPCCAGPDHKCPIDPAAWRHPLWQALDVEALEPMRFQYRYQSDGKTFTATAVGDPGCDGDPITLTATGAIVDGNATVTLPP